MRPFVVAALVVGSFTSTRSYGQVATGDGSLIIVLDLPSRVLSEQAVQPTRMLLGDLPVDRVRYFSLATAQLEEIPNRAVQEVALHATTAPARGSGIFVSPAEASAIVGRNEQIRDEVIRRECGSTGGAGCAADVHVASVQELTLLDDATENRLNALARIVSTATRGSTLVLISPGLPYRNERPALNRLSTLLNERELTVAVVKLRSAMAYTGVVRDAVAAVAQRSKTMTLLNADDVRDVPAIVSRFRALTIDALAPTAVPSRTPANTSREAPGRLAEMYVQRFVDLMRFVIAREHYDQQVKIRPTFSTASGQAFGRLKQQRVMDSEVALIQISNAIWFMARQVFTVDGKRVAVEGTRGLQSAASEEEALTGMTALAREGASWNIGGIRRDINSPTIVMWFLTPANIDRFRFTEAGTERLPSAREIDARVLKFKEIAQAPLFQVDGARAPSSGRIWLAPEGSVLKTELVLQQTLESNGGRRSTGRATITVDYAYSPKYGIWLPATMAELYEYPGMPGSEIVSAVAKYSDYRQFQAGARIVK